MESAGNNRRYPAVSVVIPVLNERNNILKCIESVKEQTYPSQKYEIIVIDNGSTDGTQELLRDLGIKWSIEERLGRAPAKNKGIEMAGGEIIAFIDGDCIADPHWLENLIHGFDIQTGGVGGEIKPLFRGNPSGLARFLAKKGYLSQSQHINHPFLPFAVTANVAYRAEVFKRIGGFNEMFGEDADLSWRMQLETDWKMRYKPEAVVYHPYEVTLEFLIRQKVRHATGTVMLYKKYRRYRNKENKSLKYLYWEYHSILRRLLKISLMKVFGKAIDEESYYQVVLEAAWKLGLIKGSLKERVFYL